YSRRFGRSREILCADRQDAADRPHARARLVRPHERSVSDGPHQLRRLERRQAMRLCRWVVAAGLAIAAAAVIPSATAEPPPGSRNFSPPVAVPNYFSNESGPVLGAPAAHPTEPAPAPAAVVPTSPPAAA